jgi:hypothetical protein
MRSGQPKSVETSSAKGPMSPSGDGALPARLETVQPKATASRLDDAILRTAQILGHWQGCRGGH